MRRLPPLNAMRAFEAAARHLSFTRAAEELHVTQAAVSHQIKALEEHLGMALFKRQNRNLLLTDAGQSYFPALRDAFDRIDGATNKLKERDTGGVLRVSTFTSFAAKWLVPRLGRFGSQHPDIEIRLAINDSMSDFNTDGIDVAIRYGSGNYKGLTVERLLTEVVFVVCSPALAEGPIPLNAPADLAQHTLLHDDLPEDWDTWLEAAGLDPKGAAFRSKRDLVFNHSEMVLQAAAEGLGVALGRSVLLADDLAAGRLVKPFDLELPVKSAYYFVCQQGAISRPKVKAFRDFMFAEVQRARAGGGLSPQP